MIKEINFGTPIKIGKTLELSWHNVRGARFSLKREGDIFIFEDTQGEWPTTKTTIANVKYWCETNNNLQSIEDAKKAATRKGKDNA